MVPVRLAAILICLSGCVSEPTLPIEVESPSLHLSGCEQATNREAITLAGGKKVAGWREARTNPALETADILAFNCESVSVGTSVFENQDFVLFVRYNQEPPRDCLLVTETFPGLLQAVLVESEALQSALEGLLEFSEIFVGDIVVPKEDEYTNIHWETGEGGGSIQGDLRLAEYYELNRVVELFWEIQDELGHLKMQTASARKGAIDSISTGPMSWPRNMTNPTERWIGSAGYEKNMQIGASVYTYETHDCQGQERIA